MPTVEELTDPYTAAYTPPPQAGVGVCDVCHGPTGASPDGSRYRRCESCTRTRRQVTRPLGLVVPVSLYIEGEQLHTVLRGYKDSPDEEARGRFQMQVAALLARFLRDHGDCIRRAAGRDWDTITIVPSSAGRAGTHPLEQAVRMSRTQRDLYRTLLEPTDVDADHREADERAYRALPETAGRSVLLIDDTFTSGARVQSAASALTLAGADVVAAVVLGRIVDTHADRYPEKLELWERQRAIPFDFDVCSLEP
jgi:predicted amidophosphoribosyltransferase